MKWRVSEMADYDGQTCHCESQTAYNVIHIWVYKCTHVIKTPFKFKGTLLKR